MCLFSGPCGVPFAAIRKQMEREYGVPLGDVPVDSIQYTEEEILEGQKWQEEHRNRKALVLREKTK